MPKIRSSADLRNHYNEISTFCHDYAEPVFITKNGKGCLLYTSARQIGVQHIVCRAECDRCHGLSISFFAKIKSSAHEILSVYRAFALFFREACRSDGFQQLCRFQGDGLTATDQKASAAVGFGLLHSLVQALAEDSVKVVAGLFQPCRDSR